MSKKQNELDRLKSEQGKFESEKAANDDKLKDLDPKKDEAEYHRVAQESKRLGDEVGKSKDAVANGLNEVEAAKKAASEKAVKEAGEKAKEHVIEAKEANNIESSPARNPNTNSNQPKLNQDMVSGIEQNGNSQGSNKGLSEVTAAQQQAKGQLEGHGITTEKNQEQEQSQDFDIDD